jgi:hypothetical protein
MDLSHCARTRGSFPGPGALPPTGGACPPEPWRPIPVGCQVVRLSGCPAPCGGALSVLVVVPLAGCRVVGLSGPLRGSCRVLGC